jgi:hypothetical protein
MQEKGDEEVCFGRARAHRANTELRENSETLFCKHSIFALKIDLLTVSSVFHTKYRQLVVYGLT